MVWPDDHHVSDKLKAKFEVAMKDATFRWSGLMKIPY